MSKYEFTGEVKVFYGRELKQIKASVSFGRIKAGEVGGWIEKNENLNAEVSGDAWVSGDAKVFGDAWVSGDAEVSGDVSKTPILITGLYWNVTITDKHISIGCQFHLIEEWRLFIDSQISEMSGNALEFWNKYKSLIIGLADTHEVKDS